MRWHRMVVEITFASCLLRRLVCRTEICGQYPDVAVKLLVRVYIPKHCVVVLWVSTFGGSCTLAAKNLTCLT